MTTDIQYTWDIASLERYTSNGVVYTAHWRVNASTLAPAEFTEGAAGSTVNASAYGSIGLEAPDTDSEDFVLYEDLTEEVVIGWVKDKLGEEQVTSMEEALAAQISEQLAPSKATGTPW